MKPPRPPNTGIQLIHRSKPVPHHRVNAEPVTDVEPVALVQELDELPEDEPTEPDLVDQLFDRLSDNTAVQSRTKRSLEQASNMLLVAERRNELLAEENMRLRVEIGQLRANETQRLEDELAGFRLLGRGQSLETLGGD